MQYVNNTSYSSTSRSYWLSLQATKQGIINNNNPHSHNDKHNYYILCGKANNKKTV